MHSLFTSSSKKPLLKFNKYSNIKKSTVSSSKYFTWCIIPLKMKILFKEMQLYGKKILLWLNLQPIILVSASKPAFLDDQLPFTEYSVPPPPLPVPPLTLPPCPPPVPPSPSPLASPPLFPFSPSPLAPSRHWQFARCHAWLLWLASSYIERAVRQLVKSFKRTPSPAYK
jgi:hypothetical protein